MALHMTVVENTADLFTADIGTQIIAYTKLENDRRRICDFFSVVKTMDGRRWARLINMRTQATATESLAWQQAAVLNIKDHPASWCLQLQQLFEIQRNTLLQLWDQLGHLAALPDQQFHPAIPPNILKVKVPTDEDASVTWEAAGTSAVLAWFEEHSFAMNDDPGGMLVAHGDQYPMEPLRIHEVYIHMRPHGGLCAAMGPVQARSIEELFLRVSEQAQDLLQMVQTPPRWSMMVTRALRILQSMIVQYELLLAHIDSDEQPRRETSDTLNIVRFKVMDEHLGPCGAIFPADSRRSQLFVKHYKGETRTNMALVIPKICIAEERETAVPRGALIARRDLTDHYLTHLHAVGFPVDGSSTAMLTSSLSKRGAQKTIYVLARKIRKKFQGRPGQSAVRRARAVRAILLQKAFRYFARIDTSASVLRWTIAGRAWPQSTARQNYLREKELRVEDSVAQDETA